MVLPLLVAVCIGLVWLLSVGAAQVRAVDAARETARALARGDDQQSAVDRGLQVAPDGAHLAITRTGTDVRVTVTAHVQGPAGLFAHLPSPEIHAEAVAADEDQGYPATGVTP